jgi:hypothetical protein
MKKVLGMMVLLIVFTSISPSQISATFVGDTTKIWDTYFSWPCGSRFFPIVTTSNDTIYITECDTLDEATCSCNYTVCTSLIGLSAGTYTAKITRQWKNQRFLAYSYSQDAGSVTFTVLKSPVLSQSVTFYQSGCLTVGIKFPDDNTVPNSFAMLTNYPNPFNPSTVIRYTIPRQGHVSLIIYNTIGQVVATLLDETKHAGTYEAMFNGNGLASGVYFCRLRTEERILSIKIIMVK